MSVFLNRHLYVSQVICSYLSVPQGTCECTSKDIWMSLKGHVSISHKNALVAIETIENNDKVQ